MASQNIPNAHRPADVLMATHPRHNGQGRPPVSAIHDHHVVFNILIASRPLEAPDVQTEPDGYGELAQFKNMLSTFTVHDVVRTYKCCEYSGV